MNDGEIKVEALRSAVAFQTIIRMPNPDGCIEIAEKFAKFLKSGNAPGAGSAKPKAKAKAKASAARRK